MSKSEYQRVNLRVDLDRARLHLGPKALPAAENYVLARDRMYRSVYFHKTTRSAEVMLRLAFRRYQELLRDCDRPEAQANVVPDAHPVFRAAFDSRLSLGTYLQLDDCSVTDFLKIASGAPDPTLASLASGIVERRLWKALDVSQISGPKIARFFSAAQELCKSKGYLEGYGMEEDLPADTAYKVYNPDAEQPATQIYVGEQAKFDHEISQISPLVRELSRRYELSRYHFPEELREGIRQLADQHLQ